jgi:hypothetical protein
MYFQAQIWNAWKIFRNTLKSVCANTENECYLIATHLPSLMESEEFEGKFLRRMIEKSGTFDLHLFLFTTTAASIHYRDAQLMQTRICLRNENLQDVMSIFECTTKKITVQKRIWFAEKRKSAGIPIYQDLGRRTAWRCHNGSIAGMEPEKQYRLPAMPDHLHLP